MKTSEPGFEEGTLNAYSVEGREVAGGDRYGYKVIAKCWDDWNGWCAYRGPTGWSDERVLAEGDMIPEEAAKALFPTIGAMRLYDSD
jgi:hypothetical protein